jgi:hypothetical protein
LGQSKFFISFSKWKFGQPHPANGGMKGVGTAEFKNFFEGG